MTENTSPRHVSYEQVKTMIDFMGQHVEFASGSLRTLEARHTSKRLWNELTKILNNSRVGTRKSSDAWSKYWSDFKNKLKNKVSILKKRKRTGSSTNRSIKSLTRLEKRALVILGPHFEKKISRLSVDPFTNNHSTPPEVKLEAYQENGHNSFNVNANENNLQSDSERESNHSNVSNECADESDEDANEHVLQSLFPKWLVEVEKKRADAELMRAKAEEQRSIIAAKNADAALVQAEALKKMADAATQQAEAMKRIALALECRDQREHILTL